MNDQSGSAQPVNLEMSSTGRGDVLQLSHSATDSQNMHLETVQMLGSKVPVADDTGNLEQNDGPSLGVSGPTKRGWKGVLKNDDNETVGKQC